MTFNLSGISGWMEQKENIPFIMLVHPETDWIGSLIQSVLFLVSLTAFLMMAHCLTRLVGQMSDVPSVS